VEKAGCDEPLTKKLVAKIKCIRFQVRTTDTRRRRISFSSSCSLQPSIQPFFLCWRYSSYGIWISDDCIV
jgi:hypothetical protein